MKVEDITPEMVAGLYLERERVDEENRQLKIEAGGCYLTDVKGALPITVSIYTRPTDDQWRRLLDLCGEIETNMEGK